MSDYALVNADSVPKLIPVTKYHKNNYLQDSWFIGGPFQPAELPSLVRRGDKFCRSFSVSRRLRPSGSPSNHALVGIHLHALYRMVSPWAIPAIVA